MRPILVCQGFQRGFIDASSRLFSVSASLRRGTCEQLLKHARTSGWGVVHSFLDTEALRGSNTASIDRFSPGTTEPYFRQKTLSAFGSSGFCSKLESLLDGPIFLISLAGLSAIVVTFFDGLELHLPIFIVTDAVADLSRSNVSEQDQLLAIETIARAHGRAVTSAEVMTVAGVAQHLPA